MTVRATPENIHWLVTKLYVAKRSLQAANVPEPTFVLMTKGESDRHTVESLLYKYFQEQYGTPLKHMEIVAADHGVTSFFFREIGCRVCLIDV